MARKPADQSVSRDDILAAAADVLREHGYEAATMKGIAAQVNLTAASLYHHFKSKDHLLLAVLEVGLEEAIRQIEPIVQAHHTPDDAKLREMVHVHVTMMTDNPSVGAAMVFEIHTLLHPNNRTSDDQRKQDFEARRAQFFARRDYFEGLFKRVIQQGMASGNFRAVDAGIFTKALMGAHNWVGVWYRPGGRLSGPDIAELMADTFLTSLQPAQTELPVPHHGTT